MERFRAHPVHASQPHVLTKIVLQAAKRLPHLLAELNGEKGTHALPFPCIKPQPEQIERGLGRPQFNRLAIAMKPKRLGEPSRTRG